MNFEGEYQFSLAPGTYNIIASIAGINAAKDGVQVTAGSEQTVNLIVQR